MAERRCAIKPLKASLTGASRMRGAPADQKALLQLVATTHT